MGSLDHVHIRVPNRDEAAEWYRAHLGFEPVPRFEFWATGFEGGPLQISADGGHTTLAVFEATLEHPMVAHATGIAFTVNADMFIRFALALPGPFLAPHGSTLSTSDLVDLDMCWSYDFCDPWGNTFELNTYDYDEVTHELIEAHSITPVRYWPSELYDQYRANRS